jgi:uncharacterized protein
VVSSELGRVEVFRAARRVGDRALTEARAVSATLLPILDALHLASAVLLSDELTVFIACDQRITSAARTAGLVVATPGRNPGTR